MNVRRDSESQRTGVSKEMQSADVGAVDALVQRQSAAKGAPAGSSCCSREVLWPSGCKRQLPSFCAEAPELRVGIHWIRELAMLCPANLLR